jgi:hypothetical protein
MKVLIDECAPRVLKHSVTAGGHECLTVQEAGWSGKENGELLTLAESDFDVFLTLDTSLRYQQNLAERRIAVVIIHAQSNRLVHISPLFPACLKVLAIIKPGNIVHVDRPR